MKKYRKIIGAVLLFSNFSFAFVDNDLDGVDDSIDKCPNTPFDQIVGQDGCPIGKIGQEQQSGIKGRFYFKVGLVYNTDNSNDSTISATSIAYAYKGFYVSLSTNYYLYDSIVKNGGLGDSFLYLSYSFFSIKNLYTTLGVNTKIPTGEDRFSDEYFDYAPSISFDYIRGKDDYFIFYGHTFKGNPNLNDTDAFSIGAGYQLTREFYSSLSIDGVSSSITKKFRYQLGYFGLYNFARKYYGTLSYSYGINDVSIDHSIFTKFGVRF